MIRSFLKNELTSSFCAQVAGIPSSTKRFIRNNLSLGPSPEFLPFLNKKDREEREKAFKVFQNTHITPSNRAQLLPSEQLSGKITQVEAKRDSNEAQRRESSPDNIGKANQNEGSAYAVEELKLWCIKYKDVPALDPTVRKVYAIIMER